jgi:hypothetical protein
MNSIKAGEIINKYGKLLSNINTGNIFQSAESLPHSKAMIKFAFYVYIHQLINAKKLNKAGAESLIIAYAHLNFFINKDKVDLMNSISNESKNKNVKESTKVSSENLQYIRQLREQKEQSIIEIQEYINECIQAIV